jgi:GMP synthase-like glutamine amidotransferase
VTLLAQGKQVRAQAFRVNDAPFWASQFHPELNYERTLERFQFYSDHYLGAGDASPQETLEKLKGGPNSREVPELLARLIRKQY